VLSKAVFIQKFCVGFLLENISHRKTPKIVEKSTFFHWFIFLEDRVATEKMEYFLTITPFYYIFARALR